MSGFKFKEMRNRAGLTQKQVAELLHYRTSTVWSWETGRTEPELKTVAEMAKLYNCTADELLGIGGPREDTMEKEASE